MIKSFGELTKEDFKEVGGKGYNLGILMQEGFPVPDGFCLLTAAFDDQVRALNLGHKIKALDDLSPDDLAGIEAAGNAIRAGLSETACQESLAQAVGTVLAEYEEAGSFAVRSSATAEDLPDASFAGQQDSFLFVQGLDHVLEAIRACWASLFNDRAISYRLKNGIPHDALSISVVVQQMIDPDFSGVAFTADPVSENRDWMTIEYVSGTGEGLVTGLRTPNRVAFDRKGQGILDHNKGAQEAACLSDGQIHELAGLAEKIENAYQAPMDIEWAYDKAGVLWALQARAITTLLPLIDPDRQGNGVYFSFHHVQNMMKPMRPLGIDVLKWVFPFDRDETGQSRMMVESGDYMFLDITDYLAVPFFRKAVAGHFDAIDAVMASSMRRLLKDPAFVRGIEPRSSKGKAMLGGVRALGREMRKALHPQTMDIKTCDAFVRAYAGQLRGQLNRERDPVKWMALCKAGLIGYLQEALLQVGSFIGPGMGSYLYLVKKTKKHLGSDDLAQTLASGLVGNATTEMGLIVGDLADEIRKDQTWLKRLDQWDKRVFAADLLRAEGPAGDLMRQVMKRYGSRGIGEIDITNERWFEDPSPIVLSIQNHIRVYDPGQHRVEYQELTQKSREAGQRIVEDMSRGPRRIFRRHYQNMVDRVLRLMPAREHGKYGMVLVLGHVKQEILKLADQAVQEGWLDNAGDIYFLTIDEIMAMIEDRKGMQGLVEPRRAKYEKADSRRVPRLVTNRGWIVPPEESSRALNENELGGTGVSAGVYEGFARVVESPDQARMEAGEILVAPFTDPGWTPLFIHAKGLVLEVGGLLTHGAIVAREYGIPAVVGVGDARTRIQTGDRIRVDGNQGTVSILESKNEDGQEGDHSRE
jgi:pyruvate,water dikinase